MAAHLSSIIIREDCDVATGEATSPPHTSLEKLAVGAGGAGEVADSAMDQAVCGLNRAAEACGEPLGVLKHALLGKVPLGHMQAGGLEGRRGLVKYGRAEHPPSGTYSGMVWHSHHTCVQAIPQSGAATPKHGTLTQAGIVYSLACLVHKVSVCIGDGGVFEQGVKQGAVQLI
jgi:hypothetical protein